MLEVSEMPLKRRGVSGMLVGTLKADDALVRRLKEAVKRELTRDELRAQRVSYAFGNMPQDSSISKEAVRAVIDKVEGEAA
jgi:hypothetical protein